MHEQAGELPQRRFHALDHLVGIPLMITRRGFLPPILDDLLLFWRQVWQLRLWARVFMQGRSFGLIGDIPRLFRSDFIQRFRFLPIILDGICDGLGGRSYWRRSHRDKLVLWQAAFLVFLAAAARTRIITPSFHRPFVPTFAEGRQPKSVDDLAVEGARRHASPYHLFDGIMAHARKAPRPGCLMLERSIAIPI